jgi:hypothetical protein
MPAATMLCGDYGNVYVGIWGAGFVVEVNPYDPGELQGGQGPGAHHREHGRRRAARR